MEAFDQNQGLIVYKTKLVGLRSGILKIWEPHDYAFVFLNRKFIDTICRNGGKWEVNLSKTNVDTGRFELSETGDTYFDMSGYSKGVLYVNGHNLGRYWNIGPQQRLYCPAVFLKKGENEILVFDIHQLRVASVKSFHSLTED